MKSSEKSRTLNQEINLIIRGLKLFSTFTPHFISYSIGYSFFESLSWFLNIFLAAELVDEVTGERSLQRLIILLCLLAFSQVVLMVLCKFCYNKARVGDLISKQWTEVYLNNKSFSMDYKNMEDPKIRLERQSITKNADVGGLNILVNTFIELFYDIFQIIGGLILLSDFLVKRSPKILTGISAFADSSLCAVCFFILMVAAAVGSYFISEKYGKKIYTVQRRIPVVERMMRYYTDDYLDDSKSCKDVHIFNQKNLILKSFENAFVNWRELNKQTAEIGLKKGATNSIITGSLITIIYLFVAFKAYVGAFGLGGFIKYVEPLERLMYCVTHFAESTASLKSNNLYLEKVFEYIDIPTEMHYGTIPTEKRMDNKYDIEFHNVSFKYPGTDKYAIKNLNLKFKVGDRIAVVGMNGSGKTTMIKLLCRLYDPTEGYITLNGIDIQKYDYEDYLKLFSVVFQDFKLFSFSVGENVAASVDYDEEKVWSSLEKAGMLERVKTMPKGLKTPVYKDFEEDGVEISGGEAQKLAIARALYKDAAFVILDEPTASLDPIAEHEIYSRFNDMVKDKTAVYISHRLSSCRFCDRILVFDNGQLIQDGSHENLLENPDGKYSELWNAQAQYYAENKA